MENNKILIIDDEISIIKALEMILTFEGYKVYSATSANEGLNLLDQEDIASVLLDIRMEGMDGITCLEKIKERWPEIPVIMISGVATIDHAITAIKKGAFDLLEKPLDKNRVLITLRNALSIQKLYKENYKIKKTLYKKYEIIGESKVIRNIKDLIKQVAPTDARVLITGENGTGKELVARNIHALSKRKEKPFIELNCAAIPSGLLESELFGHEKGSFTGAFQTQKGKFELANKGTLFFDEVGDMNLEAQSKVLRVLENGTIFRVGSSVPIEVDVRLISATNKHLQEEVANGKFREDLYYRLNVVPIYVPPLRERKEDIPLLVEYFIKEFCSRENMVDKVMEKDAIEFLKKQNWPGNIRELKNVIERAVILTPSKVIKKENLLFTPSIEKLNDKWNQLVGISDFSEFKRTCEKEYLKYYLDKNNWNISNTAKEINIQRSNLYIKIEKYFPEYFKNKKL